jgi:hypothetical protein
MRNADKRIVGKHEMKQPLGIAMHRCEDNVEMDLECTGFEDVERFDFVEDRALCCVHGDEPSCFHERWGLSLITQSDIFLKKASTSWSWLKAKICHVQY